MSKSFIFGFFQFGVLARLTYFLGIAAVFGLLMGGVELLSRAAYKDGEFRIESLVYFLLGSGGLLGLIGPWGAAVYSEWSRKIWLRRLIYICFLGGITTEISLIYFYLHVFDFRNLKDNGELELLVLPILWVCLLIAMPHKANRQAEA